MKLHRKISAFLTNPKNKFRIAPFLLTVSFVVTLYIAFDSKSGFVSTLNTISLQILRFGIPVALLAIGASVVIATGKIDISYTGVATLVSICFALLVKAKVAILAAILITIPIGLVSGIIMGIFVSKFESPPMMITWAWGLLLLTTSKLLCAGQIATLSDSNMLSVNAEEIFNAIHLSPSFYYKFFAFIIVLIAYTDYTGITQKACAIGANVQSSSYAGIKVKSTTRWAYVYSGLCAAICGIVLFFVYGGTVTTTNLVGSELIPLAIVLVGGTSLSGGYLNLWSILIAALFWSNLELNINNIETYQTLPEWQSKILDIVFGAIIVCISVAFGRLLKGDTITIHAEQKNKSN